MRLSGLLNRLNLKGNDYDKYILIPEVENRETLEDQASKYFSLYSKTWQTITDNIQSFKTNIYHK